MGDQTQRVTNDELTARYLAGENLEGLAGAAGMSLGGLQDRLRRLGVPARRRGEPSRELGAEQIARALAVHGSVAATARALGIGRHALTAQVQRHGLSPAPAMPPDLAERYRAGESIRELATHYQRAPSTIMRWLDGAGIQRRHPGRQPRDG